MNDKLSMEQIHAEAAYKLWEAVYAMHRFADTRPEAGRYYSNNARMVMAPSASAEERALTAMALGEEVGQARTPGDALSTFPNVAAHTDMAFTLALGHVFDSDARAVDEALDALWARVDVGYSAKGAFNAMISRPATLAPGATPAVYGWIVDVDYQYKQLEPGDRVDVWHREGDMGPGEPCPLAHELWQRLVNGEGERWRTLTDWPTSAETIEDKLIHAGRIVFSLPDNKLPHDIGWMPLRDMSGPDAGAEIIQYQNEKTGEWMTL